MEKHPQITLERISRVIDELHRLRWIDQRSLEISVYQCVEPVTYAEAVNAAFAPVQPGFRWGPPWSTAWFHLSGDYPESWAGSTVLALIDTGSEALIWREGNPAQGLDPNRQEYILTREAAGAGGVELYVEAAGNMPFGAPELPPGFPGADTPFTLKQAALARLDTPLCDLYQDMRVLFELAKQLSTDSNRRARLIYSLNEAVNIYRRGGSKAIMEARELLAAEFALPANASASTVNVLGNSHIDTAWLWPLRETIRKCARTFSSVLNYMQEYPDYHYAQSQPQLYAFVKEHYPALYTRIKQAVAAGRWEAQGAMWVEADTNIPSGESLVRQILYGTRFFREEFGVENNILWLPDVFGYSAALPQILRGCGIPFFMTQKISWNQFNPFPHHTFWWEGIDGSRVLAHFLPADTYIGLMTPEELQRGEKNFKDKERSGSWLYLYGYGDGGGGPVTDMLEAYPRMKDLEGLPRLTQLPAGEWFPRMAAEARDLRTWSGELYFELHRGTYTTQAKNKRANRKSELLLRDAEFFAALCPGGKTKYPTAELERAWKLVLLNQFHDIIPGSSIGWVYEDSARQYEEVRAIGEAVINNSMAAFSGKINTAGLARPLVVWNTLSIPRNGLLSLPWEGETAPAALSYSSEPIRTQLTSEDGERRLLVEVLGVPPMGYDVYDLPAAPATGDVEYEVTDEVFAGDGVLENELVRVELNEYGGIVSFYDKEREREIIPSGAVANLFQRFDDHPNNWDAWEIDITYEEVGEELRGPATLTVTESGPLRATIRVERELTPTARLRQDIRLEASSRRVDFVTTIDWHEAHALLKVAFPLAIHNSFATFDIQYGHIERPTHRNTTWDIARFEVPAHKWADLSEGDYGVALLNDCKYGYDVHHNVLRLTLLRATKSPDPEADMGTHYFTYSLLPHDGNLTSSEVPLAGFDVNVPLRAQLLPAKKGPLPKSHTFFEVDQSNLIIDTIKAAEDGDGIIVRLFETYRSRGVAHLNIDARFTTVTRTDLLERNQEALEVENGEVELEYRPFEIITLRLK